jgi:hypothetical protein
VELLAGGVGKWGCWDNELDSLKIKGILLSICDNQLLGINFIQASVL